MDTRFAITEYPDAAILTSQLDALIKNQFIQSAEKLLKSMKTNILQRNARSLKSRLKKQRISFRAVFSITLLSTILSRSLW